MYIFANFGALALASGTIMAYVLILELKGTLLVWTRWYGLESRHV